jgi:hypothetical protein
MDIVTTMQNLNWLAVFAAALSTFLIGGLWYSPLLFEKAWVSSNNFSQDNLRKRNMSIVFGLSFILSFIMALNLAMFIGQERLMFGTIAGFLTGFGWVALSIGILSLFENRSLKYVLINGGYMIVAFTVMGAILGAWK